MRVGELVMSLTSYNPISCLGNRVEQALVIGVAGEQTLRAWEKESWQADQLRYLSGSNLRL